jgi:hypothetical protein
LVVIQQQYVATLEVRHYGSTWPRPHPLGRLHGATSVITKAVPDRFESMGFPKG